MQDANYVLSSHINETNNFQMKSIKFYTEQTLTVWSLFGIKVSYASEEYFSYLSNNDLLFRYFDAVVGHFDITGMELVKFQLIFQEKRDHS